MGLAAVEAIYPTFKAARSRALRELAANARLCVTGGSDCHGPAPASRGIGNWGITRTELEALRAVIPPEAPEPQPVVPALGAEEAVSEPAVASPAHPFV